MTVQLKSWTRDEYYRLADMGFFDDQRVELIHGEIVRLSPQKKPHALTIGRLNTALVTAYGFSYTVRVQCPLDLGDSQPEPDVAVVLTELVEAAELHPQTATLVIEVARSSLSHDRGVKAELYAEAEVPHYWIFNLKDMVLEAYSGPQSGGYKSRTFYRPEETITLPLTEQSLELARIFPT